MHRQMPITPQPLILSLLKNTAEADEIDYTADFDNFQE